MRSLARPLVILLAAFSAALPALGQVEGTWENVSYRAEGPAIGGGYVTTMTLGPEGDLYAGGHFHVAGGAAAEHVARWDGEAWHPLDAGLGTIVYALAAGPNGTLYAGGTFTVAGGLPARSVAQWDGTAWRAMGVGFDYQIDALAVAGDGTVYAVGNTHMPVSDFSVAVGHVSRWDGAAWQPVGDTLTYGAVALHVAADGALYVGGGFGLRRWEGGAWQPVGNAEGGQVAALASDAQGRLYAGGWLHGPGLGVNGVARWDGTAWSALGTGAGAIGDVRALAVAGDGTVYAGGRFGSVAGSSANHVARWDGTAWHPMDGGVTDATRGGGNPGVNALVLDGDGVLHVGGYFDRVGGTISPQYARWRDGAWEPAGGGINGDVRAVAFDGAGRPVIGGLFGTAGGRAVNYVALRDTAGWQRMEPGLNSAVALTHDGAGGIVASVLMSDGAGSNGLARWDGVGWHAMGQGIPAGASCYALVTDSAGTVYYGGTSGLGGPGRVARWTGTAWESLGAPGVTTTLAFGPDGTLFAGGWFGVAKLTPMGWQNLGGVVAATGQAEVGAVAFGSDGSLYATGTFTSIGGAAADNVARWDGTAWHPLGDGLNGQGRALAVDGFGGVYVGGWFTGAGGAPLRYLARWDGEAWSDVGGGTDGPVLTLRYDSAGALWVGGRFGRAGGTSSPYVARWIDRRTTAAAPEPVAMLALEAVRPNPVRDAATIRYVLPTAVDVRVALYDALGREVAVLADGPHRAGAHTVTLQAAGLAPGVYLVRVTGANETLSRTLTVLR